MTKNTYLLLGLLFLALIGSPPSVLSQTNLPIFKYGCNNSSETIDPADAWDSASIDIIDQVCEGLLAYDLFDPELTLIPRLALDLGTWNENATELTFTLRQDVIFHDGTPFNATAVKNTFDRLTFLIENEISQLAELYEPLAELHPTTPLLINQTIVVNEFAVKFVLNYPYVPFMSLLCFSGSYIVHPDMPLNRLIALNETLIGTGPYILDYYTTTEIHFVANPGYYRPQPEIQEMLWIQYIDSVALAQAFLMGDVDRPENCLPEYIDEYEASPNIHVDPPMPGTALFYLGMNNHQINASFRRAISYAIDYDEVITTILNNQVIRMKSIIPAGILYHDPTVEPPGYDLTTARQILVDAGLSHGLLVTSSDSQWRALAESAHPVAAFNFTYNIGGRVRSDIPLLVKTNLTHIGIKVEVCGVSWPQYLDALYYYPDRLQLFQSGWGVDYNDPSEYINFLFSNTSQSNSAQVNDPELQAMMMDAVIETDPAARRLLYYSMQHYIMEDLMPLVFLYTSFSKAVWSNRLGNVPRNPMGILSFYPCTWHSTTTFTTSSNTFPPNPFESIAGNVTFLLLAFVGVVVTLSFYLRKNSYRNFV